MFKGLAMLLRVWVLGGRRNAKRIWCEPRIEASKPRHAAPEMPLLLDLNDR